MDLQSIKHYTISVYDAASRLQSPEHLMLSLPSNTTDGQRAHLASTKRRELFHIIPSATLSDIVPYIRNNPTLFHTPFAIKVHLAPSFKIEHHRLYTLEKQQVISLRQHSDYFRLHLLIRTHSFAELRVIHRHVIIQRGSENALMTWNRQVVFHNQYLHLIFRLRSIFFLL